MKKEMVATMMIVLAYSIGAFVYMHATFPDKDLFQMQGNKINRILLQLDRIEERIDRM